MKHLLNVVIGTMAIVAGLPAFGQVSVEEAQRRLEEKQKARERAANDPSELQVEIESLKAEIASLRQQIQGLQAENERLRQQNKASSAETGQADPTSTTDRVKVGTAPRKADAPSTKIGGFAGILWGSTHAQIKEAKSKLKLVADESDNIIFEDRINGLDCLVYYKFDPQGRLYSGGYLITESHVNKTDFVYDYRGLVTILEEKYGKPTESETLWTNDLYKNDPSEWGMAVATGGLAIYNSWKFTDTRILAVLRGDNFEITVKVEYISSDLVKEVQAQQEREEKQKF